MTEVTETTETTDAAVDADRSTTRRLRATGRSATGRPAVRTVVASLLTVATALVLSVGVATPAAAQGDDGELSARAAAACARVPAAGDRVAAAIARLDGPATQRGSLAWFTAAVQRATDNGRPRIAADLQRRLDRLTERRAVLDTRVAQLERVAARCAELGLDA